MPAWLTIFTAMFLHSSWVHWLGNMAILNSAAAGLERVLGWRRFLLLYLTCGIASTALVVLIHPTSPRAMIGASTAVAGVWAAWLLIPRESLRAMLPLASDAPRWQHNLRKALQVLAVCGIFGAAWGYFAKHMVIALTGAGWRVFWSLGFTSHLTGAAAGLVIMSIYLLIQSTRRAASTHGD